MALKKITFTTLIFLLILSNGNTQEAAGLIFGDYNGVNASKINPAFAFKTPNKWDIQIGGAHLFLQTDYAYIHQSNLFNTLNGLDDIQIVNYPDDRIESATDNSAVFKIDNTDSYGYVRAEVLGPGVMFNVNPKIKLGVFSRVRSFGSMSTIPNPFNYYNVNNSLLGQTYNSEGFSGAAAAWYEIGMLFAQKLDERVSVGISFKYNVGITASHFNVEENFSYLSNNIESINSLGSGTFSVGYSGLHDDRMNGKGTKDFVLN